MTSQRGTALRRSRVAGIGLVAVALATLGWSSSSATQARPRSASDTSPWVAYQSSLRGAEFGPEGLFLVHPDGSDDHEVATGLPGEHMHPDWSSDGRTLAFRADIGDYPQLYLTNPIKDPDGLRARQLTDCAAECIQVDDPALSPDGHSIAFIEDTGPPVVVGQIEVPRTFELRVANIGRDGLRHVRTLLRTRTLTELVEPRWSPDGRALVFWADHAAAETGAVDATAVFTIDADGTHRRQITPWSMLAGEADWSPCAQRLVFVTHPLSVFNFEDVVSNLYTARTDGSQLKQLTRATTSSDRATQARWTPDGQIIYHPCHRKFPRALAARRNRPRPAPTCPGRTPNSHPW